MNLRHAFLLVGLVVVGAAVLVGCADQDDAEPSAGSTTTDAWKEGLDEDVVDALSNMSAADREAALQQRVCPVSGKPLGAMGEPIKVTVEGQDVFVCCAGCVDTVKENPDEYLAKLKKE